MGRLHTGASTSAFAVAAAPSLPPWGRSGAQIQQHGAVRSGTALPEHAQAPEPEPQGVRHAPAANSHMECQKLLWNQPLAEELQGEQALTATPGSGIQLSEGSAPTAGGAKPTTNNPLGCTKLSAATSTWPQQLPNTVLVPFVQHPWERLGSRGYAMPPEAAVRLQREVRQDLRGSGPSGTQHKLVQNGELQAVPNKV